MKQFKFTTIIFLAAIFALAMPARAANVKRFFQDARLPTQVMLEKQSWTDPLLGTATRVVSGAAGATSAAVATLTTFSAQPDVPRNLLVTPGGTTDDVESCVVTITGTNIFGATISETFTFSADASTAQTGSKAFKTVTSASWAANCESGGFAATWSIGTGTKLGLKRCMAQAGDMFHGVVAGTKEGTAPTMAVDADEVEKNTAIFNTALDGSKDVDLYFVQNWGCLP